MKIVFFGTSAFGLPTLKAIHQSSDHQIAGIVTGPDKPQGRGRQLTATPIGQWAAEHGIETLLKPDKLRDPAFAETLGRITADAYVVVAFRILPESVYTLAPYAFNLHASLLPAYRGAAPIQRAIMAGETRTGVTTFLLQKRVDTGDIIAQRETPIDTEETAGDLAQRLSVIGAELVIETLDTLAKGGFTPLAQDNTKASPAPKLTATDRLVDFDTDAASVINRVRGLAPKPAAVALFRGKLVKLLGMRDAEASSDTGGQVIDADPKRGLWIAIGQRSVEMCRLQPEGKSVQTGVEFVRGYRVTTDDRFERVPESMLG